MFDFGVFWEDCSFEIVGYKILPLFHRDIPYFPEIERWPGGYDVSVGLGGTHFEGGFYD